MHYSIKYILVFLYELLLVTAKAQVDTVDIKDFIDCRRATNGVCVVNIKSYR
jgi:hypothetical protein